LRWVTHLDDASGIEGEWLGPADAGSELLDGLMALCREVYLPFLAANDAAVRAGEDEFGVELRGRGWRQGTFRYQAKCLARLQHRYAALDGDARRRAAAALGESAVGILADGGP